MGIQWYTWVCMGIHEKGDRSLKKEIALKPNNYRPISLTSIVSKLFEHILSSNIRKHLESNNILHHCQHGFRQFHSCETQLISLVQDLTLNFDEDIQTDLVSMDFAKAFDTVPHHRLLYKLQWYGIQGKVHQWISNFLINRRQKVILGNAHSSLVDVSSGVPQGTVLGPILFLIYIDDLPDCVRYSTIRLFADDCIIYRPIKSIEDTQLLQEDINAIAKWALSWLMKFNIPKCCCLRFTEAKIHRVDSTYHLYDTSLSLSDHCKYLGVILQSNLKWNRHIEETIAGTNSILGLLRRNIKVASTYVKDLAYRALIRPKLEYASVVWSPWQQFLVDNIEKVQRRSARYVLNDYRSDSSVTAMINHLNWESLEDRRNKASLHTFYKMFNNLTMIPYIQYVQLSTVTSTRYSHPFKLIPMLAKKNPLKYSFLSRTIPLWNQLPQDLVNSNSLISFKNKLDDYMIEL